MPWICLRSFVLHWKMRLKVYSRVYQREFALILWRGLVCLSCEKSGKLWINKLKLESEGPHVNFFIQSINHSLFGEKLKRFMAQECPLPVEGEPKDQLPELTKDELNAMQYVGGYVPHKLLKRYEKRSGTKYSQFIECLGNMAVVNVDSQDLLSYTKCWMDKVNRGSLFPLNDQSFCLFVEMEKNTKKILPSYVIGKSTSMQTL